MCALCCYVTLLCCCLAASLFVPWCCRIVAVMLIIAVCLFVCLFACGRVVVLFVGVFVV